MAIQKDVSARFKATLTHGHISTTNLELHNQVATALSLTGRLGEGTGLIELGLVNGDINVQGRVTQVSSGGLGVGDPGS